MTLPIANLTGTIPLAYFVWLDVLGDPLRATTIPGGYTFGASETGDPDLDEHAFFHIPSELVEIGMVTHSRDGSAPLTMTLSGLAGTNDALLGALAVRPNWQGRTGRCWNATRIGGVLIVSAYYTGWMVQAPQTLDPVNGSTVSMTLENYLTILSQPRGRTYQDQGEHDAADVSPARIRAAANGVSATAITGAPYATGGGGGGLNLNVRLQ